MYDTSVAGERLQGLVGSGHGLSSDGSRGALRRAQVGGGENGDTTQTGSVMVSLSRSLRPRHMLIIGMMSVSMPSRKRTVRPSTSTLD